jgi:outer membrane receptor for ferrienterochelin and colicins
VRYNLQSIGFETLWRAAFVGSRPFFQDQNGDGVAERVNASAYASVDARIAQRLAYGFSSFLLAENLLNAGDPTFLPLQPRTFSGGITVAY